ncbi:MAG: PAS domain S-box protein [SAR324 cluster bacterium]|nr:PAS domain S-box protein [SAR324 cluster bacterium]
MTQKPELEPLAIEITEKDPINSQLLMQGFEAFNQATVKLREYYRGIEEKVDELNHELARKNKELEQNLLEKERVKNYLSNIFESSAIGIIVTDLDGIITSINQTVLRMTSAMAEEFHGKHLNELLKVEVLPPQMTMALLEPYKQVDEQEIEYIKNDDTRLKFRLYISLMYSEKNDVLGLIINVQDITDLKKLEAEADRKNRFTVMGEMAATIAHEIRNPLGSIELFSSLLKKELPPGTQQQTLIEHISSAIKSMNHIISNLLEFTKPRHVRKERLDVHAFLYEMLDFCKYLIEHNDIQLETNFSAQMTTILGETELLKQVFHNLIMNSIQSMLEPGTLILSTRNLQTKNKKLLKRFQHLPGYRRKSLKLVEITVRDTGMGMTPDVKKKIFDPFFSTKERGTGLGLSIVHNIIESHSAVIDVESEAGQGTNVTLLFPILDEESF